MSSLLQVRSPYSAFVDALRQERASAFVQAVGIVGFALLTVLGAQVRIYVWEIPFTLQSLAIYGSGLYLGWRGGLLSQLLYLGMGMAFPVFAGDGYGIAYLLSAASAGYLLGAPAAAAVVGRASRRWNTLTGSVLAMMLGSLTLFAFGVTWLHFAAGHASWAESIVKGWLVFLPVDLAKILFVGLVYTGTRRFGSSLRDEAGR
jgi:biotin transport system substrate-specific component